MTNNDQNSPKKDLPFSFRDDKLFTQVFVHSSYLNEKEGTGLESNERLEFLGDALLESVVSDIIFTRFPGLKEGELTRLRARLVNRKTLSGLSRELDLGSRLLLGKGEQLGGGAENDSILADTFEALLAAFYIDRGGGGDGFKELYALIESLFVPLIDDALDGLKEFDFKPALQQLCHERFKEEPLYRLVSEEGLPHERSFTVEAIVSGKPAGIGTAKRKKDAEQLAAKEALNNLTDE